MPFLPNREDALPMVPIEEYWEIINNLPNVRPRYESLEFEHPEVRERLKEIRDFVIEQIQSLGWTALSVEPLYCCSGCYSVRESGLLPHFVDVSIALPENFDSSDLMLRYEWMPDLSYGFIVEQTLDSKLSSSRFKRLDDSPREVKIFVRTVVGPRNVHNLKPELRPTGIVTE